MMELRQLPATEESGQCLGRKCWLKAFKGAGNISKCTRKVFLCFRISQRTENANVEMKCSVRYIDKIHTVYPNVTKYFCSLFCPITVLMLSEQTFKLKIVNANTSFTYIIYPVKLKLFSANIKRFNVRLN